MSAARSFHEEEALGKAYDSRLMRRLLAYMRPYRKMVFIAVTLILLAASVQISIGFVQKWAFDDFIKPRQADGFGTVLLVFFAVLFGQMLFTWGQIMTTVWLGQNVQHDLRMQVFRHLQKLHLGFFDKNPVGRLVTRVTNDVNTLNELFGTAVVAIVGDLFMLAGIVAAMLYMNWQLALITFTVLPILVGATFLFRARARDAYRMVRLKLARINAYIQEHVTGMPVVQLFTQEKKTFENFDEINDDLRGAHHKSVIYYALFYPGVEVIGAVSLGLVLYFGGLRIDSAGLTFGELVAFIYFVEMFYRPIRDLSEKYNVLQASMASSERIFRLVDTKPVFRDPDTPQHIERFAGRIDFENVRFAYTGEDWVLKDLTFSIEPGERVAVVGATGAGKTSLVNLLFRFYDYQQGSIKIDGVDIKHLTIDELRSHLGLVLQDVFLFSGDYAGNVRLRDEGIADEEVRQALSRVGFDRFLKHLPDGIHTEVKERGATLSTGQKQLLSFARALAFDPGILILDEATSSVDTETEQLIQEALEKLLEGRTSIIIAHRLSTIEKADKILVLHHGELREMGKHEELLSRGGIYRTLYEMQYRKKDVLQPKSQTAAR